jgi:hypothetical protein
MEPLCILTLWVIRFTRLALVFEAMTEKQAKEKLKELSGSNPEPKKSPPKKKVAAKKKVVAKKKTTKKTAKKKR